MGSLSLTPTEQEDLGERIQLVRERVRHAVPGGGHDLHYLLQELDELLGEVQAKQAALAMEHKWLTRSHAGLEVRLKRLENSVVFRLLHSFRGTRQARSQNLR